MCEMYTWLEANHIHNKQTHLLVREVLHKNYYRKRSVWEKTLVVGLKGLDS
jgi:hypothetical protein